MDSFHATISLYKGEEKKIEKINQKVRGMGRLKLHFMQRFNNIWMIK